MRKLWGSLPSSKSKPFPLEPFYSAKFKELPDEAMAWVWKIISYALLQGGATKLK